MYKNRRFVGRVLFARDTRPSRAFTMRLIYILCIYVHNSVIITAVKYHGGRNYKNGSISFTTTAQLSTQIIHPKTRPQSTTPKPSQAIPTLSHAKANAFPPNSLRFPSRCGGGGGLGAGIPSGKPIAGIHPPLAGVSSLAIATLSTPPGHAPASLLFPPNARCGYSRPDPFSRRLPNDGSPCRWYEGAAPGSGRQAVSPGPTSLIPRQGERSGSAPLLCVCYRSRRQLCIGF